MIPNVASSFMTLVTVTVLLVADEADAEADAEEDAADADAAAVEDAEDAVDLIPELGVVEDVFEDSKADDVVFDDDVVEATTAEDTPEADDERSRTTGAY